MPTNQSGLGPIIDVRVIRGWSLGTSILNVSVRVPPNETPCWMTACTCVLAWISFRRVLVPPVSAITSMPGEAVPPLCQNVTLLLWIAPIRVVKCALPGRSLRGVVLSSVQLPVNVTL